MAPRQGLWDGISELLVPVHRDGHKFVAAAGLITVVFWYIWPTLGWLLAFLTLWIAYFFRDPDRVTPLRDGLVVAPADGRIVSIDRLKPPIELGLGDPQRVRISTHISIFDVHVNRAPVPGRVARSIYVPGAFLSSSLDKSSEENERRALIIETPEGSEVAVVQIAGQVSRRIITFVHEGDSLGVGQRFGIIRFGSRCDVYLPQGKSALVAVGQRAVAGETVLADMKSDEPEREARRS